MNNKKFLEEINSNIIWNKEEDESYRIYSNDNKSSITATFVDEYILITHSSINKDELGCKKFKLSEKENISIWYSKCLNKLY